MNPFYINYNYLTGSSTATGLLGGSNIQYATQTVPAYFTTSTERKVEVPIVNRDDGAGIFLRDEHGKLVFVPTERLYKAFCEW